MSAVTRKLSTCFPELKPGQFSITYQDEEGDEIEVMDDADLAEAMAVFNAIDRVLSFSVSSKSTKPAKGDESEDSDDSANDSAGDGLSMAKHMQNHWRNHRRWNGRRGGCRRRWHALAHMLGMQPQDMKPQMQNMMRFGMLNHFVGNGNVDHTCEELECTFVSDVNFVDGAVMQPNQSFNKKWIIKTGATAWPAGCTLIHVGGHPMGTRRHKHQKFTLGAVPANSEIEVMVVLQAPKRSRDFVSKWRMCTPDGAVFGDTLWTSIRVEPTAADTHEEIDLECKFVSDGSIPDGTTMQPNQEFDKKWIVKTGKTAWPAGCKLVHVSGHGMGTKRIKFQPTPLAEVSAESEIVLEATMQAPKRTTNFISKWRMCAPDGRQFGDYLWIFINVEETDVQPVNDSDLHTDLHCTFVADATIPDRSSIPPKEWFEKKWIVKTGPKPWPAGCVLTHVGGHPMGTKRPKSKPAPLGPLPPNVEAELSVCLKAPKPSRDFVSKWRMCTPDGRQFGDFLWALITVEADAAPVVPKKAAKKAAKKAVRAAAKAVAKEVQVAAKAAARAVRDAAKEAPVSTKAAAKEVRVAAKAVAKAVRVAAKTAAKEVRVAAKVAVKKGPVAAKAVAKAVRVAAKAAAKEVRVAAKAAVKKAPVAAKAAAKAVRAAANAAAKEVRVAAKAAAKAVRVAAKASPTKVDDKSMKVQKLLELNFPVPEEVLTHVLDSVGGNLNAAIEVLVNQ